MEYPHDDKKNQTTGLKNEEERTSGMNEQQPATDNSGSEIDLSAVDRQEGNLSHGETGGHQLDGNEEKAS